MGLADFIPALMDNYFIKLIFLIHASLVSLAVIAIQSNGSTIEFTFYNTISLLTILMAILVDKNADIALVATSFNAICIVFDILLLIAGKYVGLMATLIIVLNLVFRALSTVLLLRNYSVRAGVDDPTGGFLEVNVASASVPQTRSAYQNIDEPSQNLP